MCIRDSPHRAIVVNNLVYGSEAWVPKASQMRRLDVFHMRCLRRILGISPLDHVTNRAILLKAKTDSIDVVARRYRLRWLGHVGRMRSAARLPDGRWMSDRVPLRLLSAWLTGPRPVGRPPKPWGQSVAGDIAHCQLPEGARWRDWLDVCQERTVWEKVVDSLRGSIANVG